jgi:signal transduction histidine kinase
MIANSIRARLIAAVIAVQIVLAAGMVTTGVFYTKYRLRESIDATLRARATSVSALVRFAEDENAKDKLEFESGLVPQPADPEHSDMFEVRTSDGQLVAQSPNWPGETALLGRWHHQNIDFRLNGTPYRAVSLKNLPVLDKEQNSKPVMLDVIYALPLVRMNDEVHAAGYFIAAVSFVLVILTGIIAFLAIRKSLLPLEELAGSAAKVSAGNWDLKIPHARHTPDELIPLIEAMQTMLAGLEKSFNQQRAFVADAAHELKTPVAILKSTLQSLQQKPRSPEEYRFGLEECLEDIGRLEKLVQGLLRLARAEQSLLGQSHREREKIDVNDTVEQAVARVRGLVRNRDIKFDLTRSGGSTLLADAEDLEIIWVNLLENAICYSPEGATISLRVVQADRTCRVTVEDRGAGIPENQLANIFERFHRGDPSRARETGGFGLGLAIAKAMTEAYGGHISAASEADRGTAITVELPASADARSGSLSLPSA